MVSKAFYKSNDVIEHFSLLSRLSVTSSIKALTGPIVDILLLKPKCLLFIILLFSINK